MYEQAVKQPSERALNTIVSVMQREFLEHANGAPVHHIDQFNLSYSLLIGGPCETIEAAYGSYTEICNSEQYGLREVRDMALVCRHILLHAGRREEFYHRMTGFKNKLKGLVKKFESR